VRTSPSLQSGFTPFYRFHETVFFFEVTGDNILHGLIEVAALLGRSLRKPGLQVGVEMNFHALKIRENTHSDKVENWAETGQGILLSTPDKTTGGDEFPKGLRMGRLMRALLSASGGATPVIGGVPAAISGAWSEKEQETINDFFQHTLKEKSVERACDGALSRHPRFLNTIIRLTADECDKGCSAPPA
jgi:hypothetical protein